MSCDTPHAGIPDDRRRSKYPMISVDDAIHIVLQNSFPLDVIDVPLIESCGKVVASDIFAQDPFPAFRASIMDGYAVVGDLEPGIYPIKQYILAGDDPQVVLQRGEVSYITTGAMVPEGANAVVKIEDTSSVGGTSTTSNPNTEMNVKIEVTVREGSNIRQIGSDMKAGELILQCGSVIGPAEIGLLATVGVIRVPCYKQPVVGVMSTGSELIDVEGTPSGSQIRDSNRATLISAFKSDGYTVIDLGIFKDDVIILENALLHAANICDIVVTSGGVSMGDSDYVKPLLEKLGTVHFGRLNMKPGKPTTFATILSPISQPPLSEGNITGGTNLKRVLFFGLPGNPVSCLVTKSLFIDPALKRLQNVSSVNAMHSQLRVQLATDLTLDPERPEYHRACITTNNQGILIAHSTGYQRSSRLLSMSTSNALLCLPQGKGVIQKGTFVTALLIGTLPPPPPQQCYHKAAACMDESIMQLTPSITSQPTTDPAIPPKYAMKVGLLTISDRVSTIILIANL